MPDPRPPHAPREPLVTGPFLMLVLAHFLQALGYASMVLLPDYLAVTGADRHAIGQVMAAAAVGGLAFRPLVGWALDRWGRRRSLGVGTVVVAVSMAAFHLLAIRGAGPPAWLARFAFGVGEGVLFAGYFTLAADLVPASRRTEGLALFGISGLAPLALNPLVRRLGVAPEDIPAYLAVVGAIVGLSALCLVAVPEARPETAAHDRRPSARLALRRALGAMVAPTTWPVWVATVAFSGLVALFMSFATVVGTSRGLAGSADLWFFYAAGAAVVRLFGGRLPDRVGPTRLVAPALGVYVAGAFVMASAHTWGAIVAAGTLAGVGHGYCFPVLTSQVVSRCPDDLRGTAMATFTGLWEVSSLAFPPLLGLVADRTSDAIMFRTAGVGALGFLAIWAVLELRYGKDAPDRRPRRAVTA